ncbi:MAG: hypothetical protein M0Q41_06565 [Bacteroidales bacterium]|nr:hypothetical protein [Bacteroidales bacterium]
MRTMKFLILAWLLWPLQFFGLSQVLEPVRLEFPSRIDASAYHLELLGTEGMLMFYESTETMEDEKRKWYFSLLDTNFTEKWVQYVPLKDGLVFHSAETYQQTTVFLFVSPEGKRSADAFEVLRLHHPSASFGLIGGSLPEKALVKGFAVSGNYMLLALNLQKFTSDLLLFDLKQNSMQSIPHNLEGQTVVQYVSSSTDRNSFVVAIKHFDGNKFLGDVFLSFTSQGTLLHQWSYMDETHYIHSLTAFSDSDNSLLVAGSYGFQKRRATPKEASSPELSSEAKGMFFIRFIDDQPPKTSFNSFDKFSNIYSALSTDDLIRARQRSARSRSAEQDLHIGFQFYEPKLIRFQDQYVYSAEAFKPKYRYETRMTYDFYGRLVPFTYSIFEGYQFFSALVAAFNDQAEMLWTSDIELRDVLVPRLQKNVNVIADSSSLILTQLQNGILTSKMLDTGGQQLGMIEQMKIENTFTNDKLLEERKAWLQHWYGPYYLATGYQRISNNRLRSHNPRTVFYIQKLILE